MKIWTVTPNQHGPYEGQPQRMVRAERRSQVESYLLQGFSIEPTGTELAITLTRDGVQVEEVGGSVATASAAE